jgi:uncharacterized protein
MNTDDNGLEVLSPTECLLLATTMQVGRIAFSEQALPAIQPVNFVLDDGCVIIRTAEGTKLAAAIRNAIVAFEVDDFDAEARAGWSVTLVGRAESVRDPTECARLAGLPLRTWAAGARDRFIRIHPELVNGRRLHGVRHTANGVEPALRAAS